MTSPDCADLASRLNAGCLCVSLDRAALCAELEREAPGFCAEVMAGRPHLFADVAVFVANRDLQRMAALIAAVERLVALPAYRAHVMAYAPASARREAPARGVFLGYDFHLAEDGPQLIEINTNAGGGLLNAWLARAQRASCEDLEAVLPGSLGGDSVEHLFMAMFRAEWQAARGDAPWRTAAIVDDHPDGQFLRPEFELFRHLFERQGIRTVVCDPAELMHCHGGLWIERDDEMWKVDLVYNRLTDFALAEPAHAALAEAWASDAAVITPHPQAHALYADKRNLIALTDEAQLMAWGVDAETRATLLAGIPRTEAVAAERADDFWARRRGLFFKPAAGYGSKAAYRGDKLTRRVFDEIIKGDYVAQALAPPSQRRLTVDGTEVELKLDLRDYVYAGEVQLVAARLWQGQTTNFRTPGGGFAPVLGVPCERT